MIARSTRSEQMFLDTIMDKLKLYRLRNNWHLIGYIWRNLDQRSELKELVRWAKRKKLDGPRQAYQSRLIATEEFLFKCRVRRRGLLLFCELLYTIQWLLVPRPNYYRKGSASKYKSAYASS